MLELLLLNARWDSSEIILSRPVWSLTTLTSRSAAITLIDATRVTRILKLGVVLVEFPKEDIYGHVQHPQHTLQ